MRVKAQLLTTQDEVLNYTRVIQLTLEENCVDQHELGQCIQVGNHLCHFVPSLVTDIPIDEADTLFSVRKVHTFDVSVKKRLDLVLKHLLHPKLLAHKEGHALVQFQRSILCDVLIEELKESWDKLWLVSPIQLLQVESLQYFLVRDTIRSH